MIEGISTYGNSIEGILALVGSQGTVLVGPCAPDHQHVQFDASKGEPRPEPLNINL